MKMGYILSKVEHKTVKYIPGQLFNLQILTTKLAISSGKGKILKERKLTWILKS